MKYDIIIGNPLPVEGIVYLTLPKQNYNFIDLGAPTRDCLLYDCFDSDMVITAAYATSDSASAETVITID